MNLRLLLVTAAERTGAFQRIIETRDGKAALAAIREFRAREAEQGCSLFVLSDLSMPHMDGLELLREIKGSPDTRDVPVAIMTSSNRPNDREDATAAGCCAFFYKPQRLDQFSALIASLPGICGADAKTATHSR